MTTQTTTRPARREHARDGLGAAGARRRVTLVLDPSATSDVTVRVLGVLRRRGCEIAAVDYRRADRHAPARFEVAFDAPARAGHRVEAWLGNLVDVLEVRAA